MKKSFVTAVAATLIFAACGGSPGGGDQAAIADLFIELAGDRGVKLDESCVRDNAADFSDDDAKAMVDAGVDASPDISDDGDEIGSKIFDECVDAGSYLESLVSSFAEDETVDADCLREALSGLTVEEIDDKIFDVAFDCPKE